MKKIICYLFACCLFACCLFACCSFDDPTPTPTPDPTSCVEIINGAKNGTAEVTSDGGKTKRVISLNENGEGSTDAFTIGDTVNVTSDGEKDENGTSDRYTGSGTVGGDECSEIKLSILVEEDKKL